jgi:signal transduction histidine kinase
MAGDVQRQVFQRSFTTKDEPGHGLGTYSAWLFTERYLGGRLSFVSAEPNGTVFSVTLPR